MHSERDSSPVEDDHRSTNRRTSSAAMTTFTQNPVALRHQSCQSCRWASARVATLSVAFLVPMHDNTSRRQSVSLPLRPATRCSHIGGHAVDVTEKRWNSSTARERRGSLQPTTLTAGASWVVGSSSVNRPHDNRRRVSFDATADTTNSLSITSDAAPSSQHESQNRADSSRLTHAMKPPPESSVTDICEYLDQVIDYENQSTINGWRWRPIPKPSGIFGTALQSTEDTAV